MKSCIWLIIECSDDSPVPSTYTGFFGKSFARSAEVTITAALSHSLRGELAAAHA